MLGAPFKKYPQNFLLNRAAYEEIAEIGISMCYDQDIWAPQYIYADNYLNVLGFLLTVRSLRIGQPNKWSE